MSRHRLSIRLNVHGERDRFSFLLPVNVIDARGEVVSTSTVSTRGTSELHYERGEAPLFVRLILPNGTTETRPLQEPDHTWRDDVVFSVGKESGTSDQMAWWAMRLDMKRQGGALLSHPGMRDAWFQLWEKTPNGPRWQQISMDDQLTDLLPSQEAIQLDLGDSPNPRALVVRLDNDTPQVVSLPRQETSVLVTSLQTLSGVVTPRVVVGGFSSNAETIMEFLRAGKLNPVELMLDPGAHLAHQVLYEKVIDPIAATAAAYYLLRKRDWDRLPPRWLDNLADWFNFPDAYLIRAMSRIERGMPIEDAANLAVETLSIFMDHGIPLFAEAALLLGDLLALVGKAVRPLDSRVAKTLRSMLASPRSAGLSFSFAGNAPDKPMAARRAFERRQEVRNGQLLATAVRQVVSLTNVETTRHLPSPNNEGMRRSLRLAAAPLFGINELVSIPHRNVSGSTSKTLFLRNVIK